MIFKRAIAKLRVQDWLAITIELVIVIVGVFVGTWVANWNQGRESQAETRKMIARLDPTLRHLTDYFRSARIYFATTRSYSKTAIAGWRSDPQVSDTDFVVAAYQASQIVTIGMNSSVFSTILGTDRLRDIDNPDLRFDLTQLMTADYSQFDQAGLATPYRQNVRRVIPVEIQDAIRARCGDRHQRDNLAILSLPSTCKIEIPPADVAKAAAVLRAHPELLEDLQWHIAAVAAFLDNIVPVEASARRIRNERS